jgi:aldehyde decarbonylase
VVPWAARSTYRFVAARVAGESADLLSFAVLPVLLLRLLYTQVWITVSRHQTARGERRIVSRSLDFEQVDRERSWDDQILLTALLFYAVNAAAPAARGLPWWEPRGLAVTALLHAGPVEFLYYWLHRALHHHALYSRYHSHHHASIVTEPVTSVIHPFAEEVAYFALFAIPLLTAVATGTASVLVANGYLVYIDFMNYLGHCNFELVPKLLFDVLPPLRYLLYTPSFHSLHHTQFRTNYSLFMPLYDRLYGTLDKSSDDLYERTRTLHGRGGGVGGDDDAAAAAARPDVVVHLTHLTTPDSVLHLRLGFASLAAAPLAGAYLPRAAAAAVARLTPLLLRSTFRSEANRLGSLNMETWVVPRYTSQVRTYSTIQLVNYSCFG